MINIVLDVKITTELNIKKKSDITAGFVIETIA
jgi:hypothetical protein